MCIRFDRGSNLQTGGRTALSRLPLAVLAVMVLATPAYAQTGDVSTRLGRIENEIDTLSRAIFKGQTPPPGAFARDNSATSDIQNRLTQIEGELRTLTGRLEEQGYAITRLNEIESRLKALESGTPSMGATTGMTGPAMTGGGMTGYTGGGAAQPPSSTSYTYSAQAPKESASLDEGFSLDADPNAPAPYNAGTVGQLGTIQTTVDQSGNVVGIPRTPESDYEAAFTLLRNQNFPAAQAAFDAFIKANPAHALVPNAMYWLGETYYVRNQFPEATRVFAEAYQKYPDGAKAPDNLLKLAMALAGQGNVKDACVALGQLKKQYPAGAAPVLTRGDQEIERLKCNAQ